MDELLLNYATSISATSSAVVSVTVGYPFDSIKTRMQAFHYQSAIQCVKQTHSQEGILGFFRGALPLLISTATFRTLAFSSYQKTKQFIKPVVKEHTSNSSLGIWIPAFCAGGLVGGCVAVLNAPIEFIKLQRQLERVDIGRGYHPNRFDQNKRSFTCSNTNSRIKKGINEYSSNLTNGSVSNQRSMSCKGTKDASLWVWVKRTYLLKGARGFYLGAHLLILRDGLGTSIYFSGYELLKHKFGSKDAGPMLHIISGGTIGLVCGAILYPIDLIKSVIQRDGLNVEPKYRNASDFVRRAWIKGGIRRFYAGITPQLMRSFPVHALNFFVYERVLKFCGAQPL